MAKTVTFALLSGSTESEDAVFAVKLAKALLDRGNKVNIFLYGNGCNLANANVPYKEGRSPISDELRAHMDSFVLEAAIGDLAAKGAKLVTCHTTEYSRGTEGLDYAEGVAWGDVGDSFTKMLMLSDVAFTIGQ
ncbi:DsrE family protein [Desulfovibrio sp. OttesenSCG-928-G15]|nr:DsrE family protein [Desulfovibrio sp. OttesenSCG-928-G15]